MSIKSGATYKLTGTAVGLLFFGTIPPCIVFVLAWYADAPWVSTFLIVFGAVWLAGCTVGFLKEIRVDPRDTKEEENLEKLKPVRESGAQLVYESNVILDNADREALDRAFNRPLPVLSVFLLLAVVVSFFTNYWVLLAGLIPIGLALTSWYSINVMKKRNRKVILRGIITGRPQHRTRDKNETTHFIRIGDRQIRVQPDLYDQYIAGDIIELHYVGWLTGNEMKIEGSVFTRHRKLTPAEYDTWVRDFAG